MPEKEENAHHSPYGEMEKDEKLARFALLIGEVCGDGGKKFLAEGALKIRDFLQQEKNGKKYDGWSMTRESRGEPIAKKLEKFANLRRKDGGDYGYALVKFSDICGILDGESGRAIVVRADPREHDPAHILAYKAREYEQHEARDIRNQLLKKFSEVKTV